MIFRVEHIYRNLDDQVYCNADGYCKCCLTKVLMLEQLRVAQSPHGYQYELTSVLWLSSISDLENILPTTVSCAPRKIALGSKFDIFSDTTSQHREC